MTGPSNKDKSHDDKNPGQSHDDSQEEKDLKNKERAESHDDKGADGDDDGADHLKGKDGKVDMDRLEKVLEDRNRKGKLAKTLAEENKAMKARLEALEKVEEERKTKDLTELERERLAKKKLEELLATREAEVALERRRNLVALAGIASDYNDVVVLMLEKAQVAEKDLDVKAWFKALGEKRPALFEGGNGKGPKPTGGGPERQSGTMADEAKSLEQQLEHVRKNPGQYNDPRTTEAGLLFRLAQIRP